MTLNIRHTYRYWLSTLAVIMLFGLTVLSAEARTNTYCVGDYYDGFPHECGGHLQPECNSGAACNSGHVPWSGAGFPTTINCPFIEVTRCIPNPIWPGVLPDICTDYEENIPDVDINSGCYNEVPTCNNCGGDGQPPCPESPLSCLGCDNGLQLNETTGLCLTPSTIGAICDIDVGCADGLLCDPDASQCFTEAQAGDSCLGLPCAAGLQCTLAFECSHEPAQEGETCDITAPCDNGLYCSLGIPQRCRALKKPGELCGLSEGQCIAGAFCMSGGPNGGVCFPDPFATAISTAQCKDFYSPTMAAQQFFAEDTSTLASGTASVLLLDAITDSHGVAYGPGGDYGCFVTHCEGVEIDIAISAFLTLGSYTEFANVDGTSDVIVVEAGIPSTDFAISLADVRSQSEFIGTESSFSAGIGINPLPITAGVYTCNTNLEVIYGDSGGGVVNPPNPSPNPGPPPLPNRRFGALEFDGTDDYVSVNDAMSAMHLQVSDAFTVEAWVRANSIGQNAVLVSKSGEYEIAVENGELVFSLGNSSPGWSNRQLSNNFALDDRLWHHIALVYGENDVDFEARLYVDGTLAHESSATGQIEDAVPSDNSLFIGGNQASSFSGLLNHVRIWSAARTALQLIDGMNKDVDSTSANLLAAWSFEEARGTTLFDQSLAAINIETNDNGAMAQPVRKGDGRDVLGGALKFDGVDDYVAVDTPEFLDRLILVNALTIEAWVYPTGPGSSSQFGGVIAGKEGEYYIARKPDGTLFFALANAVPGWVSVNTTITLPEQEWHHVALTYTVDTEQVHLYLDGELIETQIATGVLTDYHDDRDQFRIGGRQNDEFTNSQSLAFEGMIDEVRVWNRALNSTEISQNHDQVIAASTQVGLIGYWRFDEGSVGIAFDSSNSQHHAVLGLGSSWRAPNRSAVSVFADYPRTLLTGMCTDQGCVLDLDADFVSDYEDNCLLVANPSQVDADFDGYGNACDADFDNNGVVNFLDVSRYPGVFLGTDVLADLDSNGVVNFIDYAMAASMFLKQPGPSALVQE